MRVMAFSASIYRVLITLLLILAPTAGTTTYAFRGSDCNEAFVARSSKGSTEIHTNQHHAPLKAVLSATAASSAIASLPTIPFTGAGGSAGLRCTLPSPTLHFAGQGESQLRRWRIKASAIRQNQLQGLYPAHAFW
jgi:hypothetical protein